MRKIISLFSTFLCIIVLSGCMQKQEDDVNGQIYFNARVIEVYEQTVHVKVTDGMQSGLREKDEVAVSKNVVTADGCPKLDKGDHIRVVFDGQIMDTWPLQLGTVYAIYKTDGLGNVIAD